MTFQRTNGGGKTTEYNTWYKMIDRCMNPDNQDYSYYGGRGITVCIGWIRYPQFRNDMGPKPDKNMEIDREDNNKGYWCGNCKECITRGWNRNVRWATKIQQRRNNRRNIVIERDGKKQILSQWISELGISWATYYSRIKSGMSREDDLFTEIDQRFSRRMS